MPTLRKHGSIWGKTSEGMPKGSDLGFATRFSFDNRNPLADVFLLAHQMNTNRKQDPINELLHEIEQFCRASTWSR